MEWERGGVHSTTYSSRASSKSVSVGGKPRPSTGLTAMLGMSQLPTRAELDDDEPDECIGALVFPDGALVCFAAVKVSFARSRPQ